jgi:hypothetical protein
MVINSDEEEEEGDGTIKSKESHQHVPLRMWAWLLMLTSPPEGAVVQQHSLMESLIVKLYLLLYYMFCG